VLLAAGSPCVTRGRTLLLGRLSGWGLGAVAGGSMWLLVADLQSVAVGLPALGVSTVMMPRPCMADQLMTPHLPRPGTTQLSAFCSSAGAVGGREGHTLLCGEQALDIEQCMRRIARSWELGRSHLHVADATAAFSDDSKNWS